jgi:hypothetical protein
MQVTSGVRELLVEAGLCSEGTVKHIFAGKHYNRGVRAHKLIYEALYRLELKALVEWMMNEGMDDLLLDLDSVESTESLTEAVDQIAEHLKRFRSDMSEKSD